MQRIAAGALLALALGIGLNAVPARLHAAATTLQRPEGERPGAQGRNGQSRNGEPRPYEEVITEDAVTRQGMFTTHRVGEKLYFEIPEAELGNEMLLIARRIEDSQASGFVRGPSKIVVWTRDGNHVMLRERTYQVVADEEASISRAVEPMRQGPVIGRFSVETFGPDSAAVVDVSGLYTSTNTEMWSLQGVQSNRSYLVSVVPFDENVEVEAVQTGTSRPSSNGAGPRGPQPPGRAGGGNQSQAQSARIHWSMRRLPDEPMMARLRDPRVGFNSNRFVDYGRDDHRAEERRIIRRFRLDKQDPDQAVSDPVEPIIYWIDPATPEWLQPWVVKGVDAWQGALEGAGFSNAIFGRVAPTPEEDPDFSLYDARHSVIYWRPSTIPNATGGQVVDPRSGQILKGEVNMYHNVMNLLRNWYFIQVSPLDERAQQLPLPDSLMGRLVEYVVTHEIGHSIGMPHNMKASSQYPADSVRNADFLRRMNHVSTLMDYSRFNYVAQPEDDIPVELLIPTVGPYDLFAVHWGYAPIPDAATPDEEWPTLNEWSRRQDDEPWLRWTTSDSPNDPGANTEAVGDADAVYASELALRNLDRVMASLVEVAEKEGRDYTLLDELYDNAVSQWGRYMGHVAAVVGAAETQERLGTGPRFTPVSKERQEEAVAFLAERAFDTPEMFVDPDILTRIEAAGVIPRLRSAQGRVIARLLAKERMDRLVEYEALADDPDDVYTAADLMADLRDAVWGELDDGTVRVDVYRRNLQRAYLEAVDAQLNPPERPAGGNGGFGQPQRTQPWESDQRPVLRGELRTLDRMLAAAQGKAGNEMTRLHLEDLRMEIARMLDPGG